MASAQGLPQMSYVRLGKSGLKVSKLILGCLSYGDPKIKGYEWVLPEEEGIEQIKAAYDLGINAFDVANSYSNGASEVILGKAIKQHNLPRDEIVILTKVYFAVGTDQDLIPLRGQSEKLDPMRYTNKYGLSRKHIFDSVEASLKRLQLDYIDVLQCHRFDSNTPIEETMQALHDVVKAGYVRYIGMSSCYAWQFFKMQSYARQHGLTEFISMQNFHNAAYREEEREMVPMLQDLGVGMIPWSPLARGFLAKSLEDWGKSTRNQTESFANTIGDFRKETFLADIHNKITDIAQDRRVSRATVAIAWSLSKTFITAPIVAATSIERLKENIAALTFKLTEEEVKAIDELYQPRKIIGHI